MSWTPEKIVIEAAKYSTRNDFKKSAFGAYLKAIRIGILDEVCDHMKKKMSFEVVNKVAINFNNIHEFRKAHPKEYEFARTNKFLEDITYCMSKERILTGPHHLEKWNEKTIRELLPRYKNITEFALKKRRAYLKALKLGMGQELHKFYDTNVKHFSPWTYEEKNELVRLIRERKTPKEISIAMSKSYTSIYKQRKTMSSL